MPRTKRPLCNNGIYHIVNRGHNKQRLFRYDRDFDELKAILCLYKKQHAISIFHYCLMANHFHILLQVEKGTDLPHFMKSISQAYAHHYRRTYGVVGCIFQSRYKSFLIERDEYLLECARYIERNSLRAGIVTDITNYPYSSYHYYAEGKKDAIITPDILYSTFGKTTSERRSNYKNYIFQERPYETILDKAISKMK